MVAALSATTLDRTQLQAVRDELGAEGPRHDAGQAERAQRLLNITPDTGELLAVKSG